MKISAINIALTCLCVFGNAHATDDWSYRWKASSTRSSENLYQANLIELMDSDYYSGLGKTTLNTSNNIETQNNTSSTSIGALDTSTNSLTINGSNNSGIKLSTSAFNEGSINSSTQQQNQNCPNLSTHSDVPLC
jgi:hypothetical protein